jgi:hypothetical protein
MALITIVSDGDPYPALAGNPLTNTAVRQFSGNVIKDQSYNFIFNYRGGTNTLNPQVTPVGSIGVALNGVVLYSPRHPGSLPGGVALLPGSGFEWNAVANASAFGADACGGFPESDGSYHYQSGLFLNNGWMGNALVYGANSYFSSTSFNGDNFRRADGHSKILGFMFDGYPIYGPYAYTNALDTVGTPGIAVQQMRSSYRKKPLATPGRPYTYSVYPSGTFIQDFEYLAGLGTLDQYNGRFCNTPDFPTGTYAYFLTFENGNLNVPSYPYIAGTSTREQRPIGGA